MTKFTGHGKWWHHVKRTSYTRINPNKIYFSKMMSQWIFGYWLALFNINVSWAKTTEEQVLIPSFCPLGIACNNKPFIIRSETCNNKVNRIILYFNWDFSFIWLLIMLDNLAAWQRAMDGLTSRKGRGKMGIKWAKRIPTDQEVSDSEENSA